MVKLFNCTKDTDNVTLGPSYNALQFWALMKKNRYSFYIIVHSCAAIFIITQYIELWTLRHDLQLALRNISLTMLTTISVFKAVTYVYWEKKWLELIKFVSTLESRQLMTNDDKTNTMIAKYTKYSRRITYFYTVLCVATGLLIISAPLFSYLSSPQHRDMYKNGSMPYPEIRSSWVPFDRTKGLGYWVVILEHTIICFYGGGIVTNFDCNAVVIMTFFAGQFRLLSMYCARMFDDAEKVTYNETVKRLKECHRLHLNLMKYSSVLNSLLSPIMFLYVIICSSMICASATQMHAESMSNMQRIRIAEYLMAIIAQLFLYCWHSNEVLSASSAAENGVYASKWYTQNVCIRHKVLLLGGQLRKSIVFTAGPFTNLNVATFITILKGSYSYYTILDNKRD